MQLASIGSRSGPFESRSGKFESRLVQCCALGEGTAVDILAGNFEQLGWGLIVSVYLDSCTMLFCSLTFFELSAKLLFELLLANLFTAKTTLSLNHKDPAFCYSLTFLVIRQSAVLCCIPHRPHVESERFGYVLQIRASCQPPHLKHRMALEDFDRLLLSLTS